ncbi:hypothetical protein TREES_T100017358 [Tupaia chinensis]|uniref:Proline-rich protein 32 n=1 Tax=Tupaia chinensis TaxID=246437 RepID=L8Y6E4_TUPCH|nr:hypothetical protein TREES_T100017358 [Tupaia chinensis]
MTLQFPSCRPKDDAEAWGQPRIPLRPPFSVRTHLKIEQLEHPSEKIGSCIPVLSSRPLRQPYGPPPAVAEESLATVKVNSSKVLPGQKQKGQDSINVSLEVSGGFPALMVGGTSVINEKGGNNARLYVPLPQGKGVFSPRGPQVRGPPHIPTLRSGVMMEVAPGNTRMACQARLAHVSFPLGSPWHPMDNWPRPVPMTSGSSGVSSCSTAHCFLPPQAPSFNPFLAMPIAFAPPLIFGPPLPYFTHFLSRGMPAPVPSNRDHI